MTANRIVQHIFNQPDLSRVDEPALEKLVSDFPFFTAARLLQAQKHYHSYNNLHAAVIKKAQLYSNNPHYFYQFITGALQTSEPDLPVTPVAVAVEIPPVTPLEPRPVSAADEEEEDWPDDDLILPEDEETIVTTEVPERQTWTKSEALLADDLGLAPDREMQLIEKEVPAEASAIPEVPLASQAGEHHDVPTVAAEAAAITSSEAATDHGDAISEEGPIKIFPLEIPEEAEATLTFQPLYTEDYFAYKRLKQPENAEELNDKGMAEMKSFTDWLRDMKDSFAVKASKDWYHSQLHRIYEDEDPEVSETVERMAMDSITLNEDIVSETLAEIWAKQQQYHTAIQIYQKLSLLNPDKNAYFAQKIKELQLKTDKK